VPEECPADVEAMIARCLDSNPDKRPSARELVEFMVQLPQQFSMDGSAIEGSNELSPSKAGSSLTRVMIRKLLTLYHHMHHIVMHMMEGKSE